MFQMSNDISSQTTITLLLVHYSQFLSTTWRSKQLHAGGVVKRTTHKYLMW